VPDPEKLSRPEGQEKKQSHGVGIAPTAEDAMMTNYDHHRALKNGYITWIARLYCMARQGIALRIRRETGTTGEDGLLHPKYGYDK
jgi:hypothetical protein